MDRTNLSLVRGVGKITGDKLQAAGVKTIPGLASSSVEKIAEITGFPAVRAALIKTAAVELVETAEPLVPPEAGLPSGDEPQRKKAKKKKAGKKDKKKGKAGKKGDKKGKKKADEKKGKKGKKKKGNKKKK